MNDLEPPCETRSPKLRRAPSHIVTDPFLGTFADRMASSVKVAYNLVVAMARDLGLEARAITVPWRELPH